MFTLNKHIYEKRERGRESFPLILNYQNVSDFCLGLIALDLAAINLSLWRVIKVVWQVVITWRTATVHKYICIIWSVRLLSVVSTPSLDARGRSAFSKIYLLQTGLLFLLLNSHVNSRWSMASIGKPLSCLHCNRTARKLTVSSSFNTSFNRFPFTPWLLSRYSV